MLRSEDVREILASLVEAQKKFSPVVKAKIAKGTKFNFAYADLSAVLDEVIEPLNLHGIVLMQDIIQNGENYSVETILFHISGEFIGSVTPVFMIGDDPQAFGSAVTYAKRYGLSALLGVATEDDDGNGSKIKTGTVKEPDDVEQAVIDKVHDTLFDSTPEGFTLSKKRIAAVIFAMKGSYPREIDKAGTIAAYFINNNKLESLCTKNKKE
jgi:hypothetical protein